MALPVRVVLAVEIGALGARQHVHQANQPGASVVQCESGDAESVGARPGLRNNSASCVVERLHQLVTERFALEQDLDFDAVTGI